MKRLTAVSLDLGKLLVCTFDSKLHHMHEKIDDFVMSDGNASSIFNNYILLWRKIQNEMILYLVQGKCCHQWHQSNSMPPNELLQCFQILFIGNSENIKETVYQIFMQI